MVAAGARVGIVEAAFLDRAADVQDFLDAGTPVDYADESGMTALMGAAQRGNLPLMAGLLDRGANLEARDATGHTPLYHSIRKGGESSARFLLDRGADVSVRNAGMPLTLGPAVAGDNDLLRLHSVLLGTEGWRGVAPALRGR